MLGGVSHVSNAPSLAQVWPADAFALRWAHFALTNRSQAHVWGR
jgi:hypothetical protein